MRFRALLGLVAFVLLFPFAARAGDQIRVHIGLLSGEVQFAGKDDPEWSEAQINMPLAEGDRLWAAEESRAELQLSGGFFIRMDERTSLDVLSLNSESIQFYLDQGHTYVNNLRGGIRIVQIDTPTASVRSYDNSIMMLDVNEDGTTEVSVLKGYVYAESRAGATRVTAGRTLTISADASADLSPIGPTDEWERWNFDRDKQLLAWGESSRYLPDELHSYSSDFDANGRWVYAADYGWVWTPVVAVGWSPYTIGTWSWFRGNYVWVSYEPWGWAPYHYGRWAFVVGRGWCWVPPAPGAVYWGPGYVGWVFTSTTVAWVPLAPGEIYYGYGNFGPASVNITNVNINTVVVNRNYVNLRVKNSFTVIERGDFGKPNWQRRVVGERENPFVQKHAGKVEIAPPITARPVREGIRPVTRPPHEREERREQVREEKRERVPEEKRERVREEKGKEQERRERRVETPRPGEERRIETPRPEVSAPVRKLPPERVMRTNPEEVRSQRRIVKEKEASAFRQERPADLPIRKMPEPRVITRKPQVQEQRRQQQEQKQEMRKEQREGGKGGKPDRN